MTTRRSFLSAAAGAAASGIASAQAPSRPNVLLILADDLADWMLGCYGNREIRTPNIDALARTGVRFLNSFVATPICSASRATLMTGRMPRQHGIHDFLTANPVADPPQGQKEPPASFANETFLTDMLAAQGYRCGYVGKWHLGNDRSPGRHLDFAATVEARTYSDPVYYLNGKETARQGFLTELNTEYACQFLKEQPKDKPFFLTLGYLNPHTPYTGHPAKYYDMYAGVQFDTIGWEPGAPNALREKEYLKDIPANIAKCAASVTALDDQIPMLTRCLQERGMWENTIVVFTGDNGYLLGRHGLWSKGHASNPINMYEEVMRVPMIWSQPGRIPMGNTRPELVSFYDFLPTVAEAAGAPLPAGRNLAGRSYLPLLMGRSLPKGQPWPVHVHGHFRNTEMTRDNRYKLVVRNNGAGPNELYDLRSDPREQSNLYDDPQFINPRDRLAAEMAAFRKRTSS